MMRGIFGTVRNWVCLNLFRDKYQHLHVRCYARYDDFTEVAVIVTRVHIAAGFSMRQQQYEAYLTSLNDFFAELFTTESVRNSLLCYPDRCLELCRALRR